jgi:hypothetical protein
MQPIDPREADDVGGRLGLPLDRTPERRALAKPELRPVLMVVVDELVEQAAQVVLAQDDDVVK